MADELDKNEEFRIIDKREIHPNQLDRNPTSGLVALHNKVNRVENFNNQIVYGRVLEVYCPPNSSLKTKYTIPSLNMAKKKELEDFLLYVQILDASTMASTLSPQSLYKEYTQTNPKSTGAKKSFGNFDKNNPEEVLLYKRIHSAVGTQHTVLAPKTSSGLISSPPKSNSIVKVELFKASHISNGVKISGFYEKIYDDDIFEQGYEDLLNFFSFFRQKYIEAVNSSKNIIQQITSNLPNIQSYGDASSPTEVAGVISGEIGSVSDSTWPPVDVVAEYIGDPSRPNSETYNRIIDQFNVETNPRYQTRRLPSGQNGTFCNIFVADVTWAMGTPVPWQIDENGNPQPMAAKFKRGWSQLGVEGMTQWLQVNGPKYGWKEISAQEAQDNANKGLATVAIYYGARRDGVGVHHTAIVRPGVAEVNEGGANPRSAHAGFPPGKNKNNISIAGGFGSNYSGFPKYYTCFSSNRYITPTQQQLDRANTTIGPSETQTETTPMQQEQNPEESSSEQSLEQS